MLSLPRHTPLKKQEPSLARQGMKTAGTSLDPATRSFYESRLGEDLSSVRLHSGRAAAQAASALNAQAYTLGGRDIVFGAEAPSLGAPEGRKLLGHELAHVVQQRKSGSGQVSQAEAEATVAAEALAAGAPVSLQASAAANTPMKQELETAPQLTLPPLSAGLGGSGLSSSSSSEYLLTAFETNSAELTDTHEVILQQIAADLNAQPLIMGGYVTIWGFADSRGSEAHNQELGQQRADAVRERLQQLVTDEDTRQQIRAYSLGESLNEEEGDVAANRRVEITVTRRSLGTGILSPGAGDLAPLPPISTELPEQFRIPVTPPGPLGAPGSLPPWFWQVLTPPSRPQIDLHALSEALTDGLRQPLAGHTADLADRLAGAVGIDVDRNEIRRSLDQALINGGEAGLKKLLELMIFSIAGRPTQPSASPYGPPSRPFSAPGERIFTSPTIRW